MLTIIIPSYNDSRIVRAISSVLAFDDVEMTKILVVDGGSKTEVLELIKGALRPVDVLVSEPDKGIFDALNKGVELCDTEFLGWLGSDDMFSGQVLASEVVSKLENCELFIGDLCFFRNGYVTRKTASWPSRYGLMSLGMHNPHFATFGRSELFKSERYNLDIGASDIDYFIRIFKKRPRIVTTNSVITLQAEGGHSNSSYSGIMKFNLECVGIFSRDGLAIKGYIAVVGKLGLKFLYKVRYFLLPVTVDIVLKVRSKDDVVMRH